MASGRSDGLVELAQVVAATGGTKKATLILQVSSGGGIKLSIQNAKGEPIIMDRGSNMGSTDESIDGLARWAFYALAGKALGIDL